MSENFVVLSVGFPSVRRLERCGRESLREQIILLFVQRASFRSYLVRKFLGGRFAFAPALIVFKVRFFIFAFSSLFRVLILLSYFFAQKFSFDSVLRELFGHASARAETMPGLPVSSDVSC